MSIPQPPPGPAWSDALRAASLTGNQIPRHFEEAPFLGNGGLGAFLVIEDETVVVHLDHNSARDHQPVGGPLWGGTRFPLGTLRAALPGPPSACSWRLELETATMRLVLDGPDGRPWQLVLEAWITEGEDALVVTSAGGVVPQWRLDACPAAPPRAAFAPSERPADLLDNQPATATTVGPTQVTVRPLACGGGQSMALASEGPDAVIAAAIAAPRTELSEAQDRAVAAAADVLRHLPGWRRVHRRWWRSFFRRSHVEVPDPLGSFFWVQLYKLASATRADRAVITTMGPWLTTTPWPGAWWNLNVQLSYPVAARTGHEELDSLTTALERHGDQLRRNAGDSRHAAIGRASQDDLDSGPCPPPGHPGTEAGNLLWALHTSWSMRAAAGDTETIGRVLLPLLEAAVARYESVLERDPAGNWHIPVTHSPEFADTPDANYDLALLTWGLRELSAHAADLGLPDRWGELLAALTPPPTDPDEGLLIGSGCRLDRSHRHYSHLLWFEPLRLFDPDDPAAAALLRTSLSHWLSMPAALRGYSRTGAASMYAQLGDGDAALAQLNLLLAGGVSPTTMYRETGPVLETPLAAARALLDLLLDDAHGRVRVFPAVPSSWPDVSFDQLRIRGGHRVSATRQGGHTTSVCLSANPSGLESSVAVLLDTDIPEELADASAGIPARGPRGASIRAFLRPGEELRVLRKPWS